MSKHTPGPWTATEINNLTGKADPHYIYIDPEVAVVERKVEGHDQNDLHDARLIAAAPELFEALAEFLNCWDACESPWTCIDKARAAIAKATGED